MRRYFVKFAAAVSALCLIAAAGLTDMSRQRAYAESYSDEIASSERKIEENKERLNELSEKKSSLDSLLSELNRLKSDASEYIAKLDEELASLRDEIAVLEEEIEELGKEIEITKEELAAARADEAEQYASMKLRIKYMYEKGSRSILGELLGSGSLRELLNKAEYIEQVSEYDRKKLDEFVEIKRRTELKEEELQGEKELLLEEEALLSEQASEIETLSAEKEAELSSYNARIREAESEIGQMRSEIAGIEAAIAEEESNIAAIEARIRAEEEARRKAAAENGTSYETLSIGDISFVWPCPSSSTISSYFGERESPTEGASTNHKGVDIAASTGSAVLAAAGGTVVIATYSVSAGNYIMISHGGSVYTVYMHLSSMSVTVGDEVSRGETIGKVGSTGYSTGPHLHFGLRIDGTYVNPLNYVSP